MSEEPPHDLPRIKARLPFEERAQAPARGVGVFVYGLFAGALAALALYMGLLERHALTSPYVVAPAIGAAWFALRTFMTWGSRN